MPQLSAVPELTEFQRTSEEGCHVKAGLAYARKQTVYITQRNNEQERGFCYLIAY